MAWPGGRPTLQSQNIHLRDSNQNFKSKSKQDITKGTVMPCLFVLLVLIRVTVVAVLSKLRRLASGLCRQPISLYVECIYSTLVFRPLQPSREPRDATSTLTSILTLNLVLIVRLMPFKCVLQAGDGRTISTWSLAHVVVLPSLKLLSRGYFSPVTAHLFCTIIKMTRNTQSFMERVKEGKRRKGRNSQR